MAKKTNRLSSTLVQSLTKEGMYCDGNCLYLVVNATQSKQWIYRYSVMANDGARIHRRHVNMGLGGYPSVSLAEARLARDEAQLLRNKGVDPLEYKRAQEKKRMLESKRYIPDFETVANELIAMKSARWRNDKHAKQWPSTLKKYAYPLIGKMQCDQISIKEVRQILDPIWSKIPTTADRVRNRIESVLNYATVSGYRDGPNPAAWRSNLEYVYERVGDIWEVRHHPAMPYVEVPKLFLELDKSDLSSAKALMLLILTAARTTEIRGMRWDEIDFEARVWNIPAARMKNKKPHRVPLTDKAMSILKSRFKSAESDYVFPGKSGNRFMCEATMNQLMKRLGHGDFVVHGFRSSFTDWAAEIELEYGDVAQKSLAHTVSDETTRSYYRTDLLNQRRNLMDKWADYCIADCQEFHAQHRLSSNFTVSPISI